MAVKDRTSEFANVVLALRSRHGMGAINRSQQPRKNYSQLAQCKKLCNAVRADLGNTALKLEKLSLLVYKRSQYENHDAEINSLAGIVQGDIVVLNRHIARLLQHHQSLSRGHSQAEMHMANIIVGLQYSLAALSSDFKACLEHRAKTQAQGQSLPRPAGHRQPTHDRDQANTTQHSGAAASKQIVNRGPFPTGGLNQPELVQRHRPAQQQSTSIDMGDMAEQQLRHAPLVDSQQQDRLRGLDTVNKTISELGTIFSQLASMVHEQGQLVQRIDDYTLDTEMNVEAAHTEILNFFATVTSNRSLMLKLFAVLIVFVVLFVGFMK